MTLCFLSIFHYCQKFAHSFDASFFLVEIGMHIEIERRSDIGVAEYGTDGFIIALAFDAAGGKCVSQSVEHDQRNTEAI